MWTLRYFFVLCALLLNCEYSYAIGQKATFEPDPRCSLELSLRFTARDDFPSLVIKNISSAKLELLSVSNRRVLSFVVFDKLGNQLQPRGIAKVDPKRETFFLDPNSEKEFRFERLEFLTDSALFGFELHKGEKYRIIAIYRPYGVAGPNFFSDEVEFIPSTGM
jgi:hypothetical protein